jgi:hypothetical protein
MKLTFYNVYNLNPHPPRKRHGTHPSSLPPPPPFPPQPAPINPHTPPHSRDTPERQPAKLLMFTPNSRDYPMSQSKQADETRFCACKCRAMGCGYEGLSQLLRCEVVGPAAEAAEGDGG